VIIHDYCNRTAIALRSYCTRSFRPLYNQFQSLRNRLVFASRLLSNIFQTPHPSPPAPSSLSFPSRPAHSITLVSPLLTLVLSISSHPPPHRLCSSSSPSCLLSCFYNYFFSVFLTLFCTAVFLALHCIALRCIALLSAFYCIASAVHCFSHCIAFHSTCRVLLSASHCVTFRFAMHCITHRIALLSASHCFAFCIASYYFAHRIALLSVFECIVFRIALLSALFRLLASSRSSCSHLLQFSPFSNGILHLSYITFPTSPLTSSYTTTTTNAGTHTVSVQWQRQGSAFKSWASNPTFSDGFTNSRNLYVALGRNAPYEYIDHLRHNVYEGSGWETVGGKQRSISCLF
jgi:hypothetical protein